IRSANPTASPEKRARSREPAKIAGIGARPLMPLTRVSLAALFRSNRHPVPARPPSLEPISHVGRAWPRDHVDPGWAGGDDRRLARSFAPKRRYLESVEHEPRLDRLVLCDRCRPGRIGIWVDHRPFRTPPRLLRHADHLSGRRVAERAGVGFLELCSLP